jgi:hypothetical protein
MRKFSDRFMVPFPSVPVNFQSQRQYETIWQHLLQYEVYLKIMSPTRQKKSSPDSIDSGKYLEPQ